MAIFKALAATYKAEFFTAFFINFIVVWLQISTPFIITYLIRFMSSPSGEDGGIWLGIGLVSAYIIASWGSKIVDEQAVFLQERLGIKAYSALVVLIYKKTLKISPSTNKEFEQGEIINFMQVDAEKAQEVAWWFPPIARLPISLLFGITFLFYFFGIYLLPALAIGGILSFFNFYIAIWLSRLEDKVLERKDKRMNTTTELINNVKIVKLNSWGEYFLGKISQLRKKELFVVKKLIWLNWVEVTISFLMSPAFMIATFSFYFGFGNSMSIASAFAARQVLFSIQDPIEWIPKFFGIFAEFLVSMRRIQKFLLWTEINQKLVESLNEDLQKKDIDILINNASFTWAGNQEKKKDDEDKDEEEEKKSQVKGKYLIIITFAKIHWYIPKWIILSN